MKWYSVIIMCLVQIAGHIRSSGSIGVSEGVEFLGSKGPDHSLLKKSCDYKTMLFQ